VAELSSQERQISIFLALDSWHRHRLPEKVATTFGITKSRARQLLNRPEIRQQAGRLRQYYQGQLSDSSVTEAKEHVADLDELYRRIPPRRISLQLRILARLRVAAGDGALS